MRFPILAYENVAMKLPKKDPEMIYAELNDEQKKIVDEDLKNMRMVNIGPNQIAQVNPALKAEAWKKGARAIGSFICAKRRYRPNSTDSGEYY